MTPARDKTRSTDLTAAAPFAPVLTDGDFDHIDATISPEIRLIASLLPSLSERGLDQFCDGLGARIAFEEHGFLRRERLAILLDFLRELGRPPSAVEYRDEATDRARRGLEAVPLSTLEGYYGGYPEAVDAAVAFRARGTAARVQTAKRGHKHRGYWTEERCMRVMFDCRDQIGHWPSDFEFKALRRAGAKLRAAGGSEWLELPLPKAIRGLYGSYGEMLAQARALQDRKIAEASAATSTRPAATLASAAKTPKPRRRRTRSANIKVDPRSR